jgi:integrase
MESPRKKRTHDNLTVRKVRAFLAEERKAGATSFRKLSDRQGLFITTTKAGNPVWRIAYRFAGAQRTYTVGAYPDVSLAKAREVLAIVKQQLKVGVDPTIERRAERAKSVASFGDTFREATTKWLAHRKGGWSVVHYRTTERALERDVLPLLGALPLTRITPELVAHVIDRITARGADETAGKVRQCVERIFAYALVEPNPAVAVAERLKTPEPDQPLAALLTFPELGDVLRRTELLGVTPAVRRALRLVAFCAVRIGNVLQATWDQFDLDSPTPMWVIPRTQMKAKKKNFPHKIVLGPTIAAELRQWRQMTGHRKGLVFTSPFARREGRSLSHEALEKVYSKRLGLADKHTVHGWRSAFSTLAREAGGFAHEVVELALDHEPRNEVARAYDRGERLEERIRLMTWWDTQLVAAEHQTTPLVAKVGVA